VACDGDLAACGKWRIQRSAEGRDYAGRDRDYGWTSAADQEWWNGEGFFNCAGGAGPACEFSNACGSACAVDRIVFYLYHAFLYHSVVLQSGTHFFFAVHHYDDEYWF
jgi:hypothetical protein